MIKIIVVSDSHGQIKELEEIYNHFKGEVSYFIHCGDSELDENHPLFKKFMAVNGNCDEYSFRTEFLLTAEKYKILVTHGHIYSVKYNLNTLYAHAAEYGINLVLFGHTHYPVFIKEKSVTFINPGSTFANRGVWGRSFALVTLDKDDIKAEFYDMNFNNYKINE